LQRGAKKCEKMQRQKIGGFSKKAIFPIFDTVPKNQLLKTQKCSSLEALAMNDYLVKIEKININFYI
jgi:hypothetical protein